MLFCEVRHCFFLPCPWLGHVDYPVCAPGHIGLVDRCPVNGWSRQDLCVQVVSAVCLRLAMDRFEQCILWHIVFLIDMAIESLNISRSGSAAR